MWVIVALGDFSRAPGVAEELKPSFGQKRQEAASGRALLLSLESASVPAALVLSLDSRPVCALSA